MDAVRHYMGTPLRIRADFGTENVVVRRLQLRLRNGDTSSYIDGASTQNQRIESWWGNLRRQHMQFYMDLFHDLQDSNEFNGSHLDKSLVQFCFMAVIQVNIIMTNTQIIEIHFKFQVCYTILIMLPGHMLLNV